MKALSQAEFWRAMGRAADLPPPGVPEIALAGRSNVGKSSALNALTGRRALARTSKTPGRTQTINFFTLGGAGLLVDLPGYGYARVPLALRAQWGELVGSYVRSRESLVGVVVLVDARHPLMPLDRQLIGWLGDERRRLILLTKADKLSRVEQKKTLQSVCAELPRDEVRLFSSVSGLGVEECRDLLEQWLAAGRENKRPPVKGNKPGDKAP
jgi:GTP-binding protein